jgi:hypothetical protein
MDPQHCHQGYEYSLAPIIKPAYATDYYPSAPQQFVLEEYRYIILVVFVDQGCLSRILIISIPDPTTKRGGGEYILSIAINFTKLIISKLFITGTGTDNDLSQLKNSKCFIP